jgi:D-3-phosphoglycerate dehydrogenase / 2-oxoglutarate reductase
MKKPLVCITDYGFANVDAERRIVEAAGGELRTGQCKTPAEVLALCAEADVVIAQWAPLNAEVIAGLKHCKGLVRYGIGVDTIDLQAAAAAGVPVANVPDYCIDEVADHTLALALSLVRQLGSTDARVRAGEWSITPPSKSMPALRKMTFATAGFGRIARSVLARAAAFGCRLAAYDPFVPAEVFERAGVARLGAEELFAEADILSLNLPLTKDTRQFANAARLDLMKSHAVLVNTARGGLVDTHALAAALAKGRPFAAGVDVFETEPLEPDHPLRNAPNALLTSHTAWFSADSVGELQRLAAEEAARRLRGEDFKNSVKPS